MAEEAKNEDVKEEVQTSAEQPEAQPKKAAGPEREDVTTLHERAIATMSYFGFLSIVPFYLKKDSDYCRFHGKQGLLLAILFFMAQLFSVINFIHDLIMILQVGIMFYMGFPALSGRWKKLPYVYDWACQLEDTLTLKTKEEELEEVPLKPNELGGTEEKNEEKK